MENRENSNGKTNHLFLDTNILLNFYESSASRHENLESLLEALDSNDWKLWINEQLVNEFWKNRTKCFGEALSEFKKNAVGGNGLPNIVREHAKFKTLREYFGKAKTIKQEIVESIERQLTDQTLEIDCTIKKILGKGYQTVSVDEVFSEARQRSLLGLPPGKSNDIGDRVHWVSLIRSLPKKANLHVISKDGDFGSNKSFDTNSSFLRNEWKQKNQGNFFIWSYLNEFLSTCVPSAKTARREEYSRLITDLEESQSFEVTHRVVAKLGNLTRLEPTHAEKLSKAILSNEQVHWISTDKDVARLINLLVNNFRDSLSEITRKELADLIEGKL